jgi:hypothetical protein
VTGWVRIYRSLLDHPLWTRERFSRGQAWVDLVLRAAHKDHVVVQGNRTIQVGRGQVLTSQVRLAINWQWNRETVSRFLSLLKSLGMVAIETSRATDTGYTLLTLLNYNIYQGGEHDAFSIETSIESSIQASIEPASSQHRTDTIKKEKKGKKGKNGKTIEAAAPPSAPKIPVKGSVGKVTPLLLAEHRKRFVERFHAEPRYHRGNDQDATALEREYGLAVCMGWLDRFFAATDTWWACNDRWDFDAFAKPSTTNWLLVIEATEVDPEAWEGEAAGDVEL